MSQHLESLVARLAIEDAVTRMFVATDERDWATLERCFTNPFMLDMTSMVGGAPATLTPAEVASAWAEGFKPLDCVHHQVGNMRATVNVDTATVNCYGVALHHRAKAAGLKTRIFVGTYELSLVRDPAEWRIDALTFKLKFIDGNLTLEK